MIIHYIKMAISSTGPNDRTIAHAQRNGHELTL